MTLQVKDRVRTITRLLQERYPRDYNPQMPMVENGLTSRRKILLFPEYHGE